MNTLVLIGLALVVAGFALLAVRFAPRVRRQIAASAAQPRTVADLVRLREQATVRPARPTPRATASPRAAAAPVTPPQEARPVAPAPRVAPVAAAAPAPRAPAPRAPEPQAPAFVPPPPRPTPVAGRVRRESAEPPAPSLDGDNSPWQRGARMAVGLGGGQPWREPPAPPAPLRIVPAAEPPAPEPPAEPESATPVQIVPTEAESQVDVPEEPSEAPAEDTSADDAPVRLVPREAGSVEQEAPHEPSEPVAQPQAGRIEPGVDDAAGTPRSGEAAETGAAAAEEVRAQSVPVSPEPAPRPEAVWIEPGAGSLRSGEAAETGTSAEETPVESVPAEVSPAEQPVAPEPVAQPQAVWIEPGATGASERETAEPAESAPTEGEIPLPDGWDDVEGEDLPAGAVPERFAEERTSAPEAQVERRRSRQTPDERAAEQAAADLALLRTFGFADPGLRPDSAPVVEMERPDEEEPRVAAGDAQPVRYRVVRRDGSVVGGATVTLLDDRGGDVAAGAADAEGRGELVAPSPGGYVLVSTAAGHQPGAVAITVNGSVTETDILVARSSSVSGSVVGEDGPIVGARVTLVQDGEAVDAVDTGADGTYRISDIGAGEYGLSVAAAGCEPVATLLDVADEADMRHDVVLEPASPVADSDLVEDDAMSGLR